MDHDVPHGLSLDQAQRVVRAAIAAYRELTLIMPNDGSAHNTLAAALKGAGDLEGALRSYREAGGDYFTRLDPDKQTRRLVTQLERLGHIVTLREAAA